MALELDPFIFQIVGYQNSGKTTLVEKLVRICAFHKVRVGTIKHHGHGGKPTINHGSKDSDRHLAAGATVTSVEGDGILHLILQDEKSLSLEHILNMYKALPLDIIIIEGYKQELYPKVALVRNQDDYEKLSQLSNIQAFIGWDHFESKEKEIPSFHIKNEAHYIDWLMTYLSRRKI